MKRVEGQRLDQFRDSKPARADLLRVFEKICEAVAFAHSHGVIHRDLKPANIMVGSFGEALIMDWGVAKLLAAPADLAAPASPIRTPGYLPPAQPPRET